MEVTIKIPKKMIREVQKEVKEQTGREPTDQQLERFFRKDVNFMYKAAFYECLEEGVQAHFG